LVADFHDDFVVRFNRSGHISYAFYQVKTNGKKNYNWKINDIFGINTRIKDIKKHSADNIENSYAGKLLQHTINFKEKCEFVIFQTNIHIDDNVERISDSLRKGDFSDKYLKIIIELFNDCFVKDGKDKCNETSIKNKISKLTFETDVQHLKSNEGYNFPAIAREKIYKYSEIDLDRQEVKTILLELVDLVEEKSSGIIGEITSESIEKYAGISINDLLGILSISKEAYDTLLQGGDNKALKSASIIQRLLLPEERDIGVVNYCARCKTNWDAWFRQKRHTLQERDWISIKLKIRGLVKRASSGGTVKVLALEEPLKDLAAEFSRNNPEYSLTEDLLLGAIFSELILDNR
jgi:hypothetical protein